MSTVRTKARTKIQAEGGRRDAPERTSLVRDRRFLAALVVLAIGIAAAVAYSTSFNGVFVFDDQYAIVRNPNIRQVWPLTQSMSSPPESPVSARPVASLSLAINYALTPSDVRDVLALPPGDVSPDLADRFMRNLWGYHLMNLVLHVLAALALYGVVRRTLDSQRLRPRFGSVSTLLAGTVALVWVVHPLTTDAVTYVTQRTEVLMGLFYLLTLYCAIRASATGSGHRRILWSIAAVAACALGMGSKQTMVTAPFVVLAWDWIFGAKSEVRGPKSEVEPTGTSDSRLRGLRWPLYACLAATGAILVAGILLERWPHSIGIDRGGWTPWTYFLTQTGVIAHYLRLVFVPAPLVLDYDGWPMAQSLMDVAPYVILVAALFATTVVLIARREPWGFVGAWFFALLIPSSSVLPLATEIAAERRMYTAAASVVALVVIGGYLLGDRLRRRFFADAPVGRSAARVAAAVAVALLVVGCSVMTNGRNRDFWSEESIWRDAVDKRPDNPRARTNYGVLLSTQQRNQEAETQLREALRLRENDSSAHGNLGSVLCKQGRVQEGITHLERAIALDPDFEAGYRNLGEAYGSLGRRDLAAKYFALAAKATPDNVFVLNRLGWLLAASPEDSVRNGAEAVRVAERAVQLTSGQDLESLRTLAAAYAEADRFDDAIRITRQAAALVASRGDRDLASRIEASSAMFQAHQKVREQ